MNEQGIRETAGEREALDKLRGAMRFVLAFYEPGQTYLDANAWKNAETSARVALKVADAVIAARADQAPPIAPVEREALIARLAGCLPLVNDGRDDQVWCSVLGSDLRDAVHLLAAKAQAPAEPVATEVLPTAEHRWRGARCKLGAQGLTCVCWWGTDPTDCINYEPARYVPIAECASPQAAPKAPAENTRATQAVQAELHKFLAALDQMSEGGNVCPGWDFHHSKRVVRSAIDAIASEAVKAPAAPVARAHLDWLGHRLFERKWNGVLGPGSVMQWSLAGNYRHVCANMRGDTFIEAIAAARCAENEAAKEIDAGT